MASTAAPARRTQAQRREESDARLLAAAAAIIAEEGYLAATLERVGERAGFSRGLASRKYGSKDGLIEAVIWRVSAHVHAEVDQAITRHQDPLEQLLALFDRFVDLAQHDIAVRAYFVLFSAKIANRLGQHDTFEAVQERFGERIEALVEQGQAHGSIAAGVIPRHIAFMLGSQLAGIAIELVAVDSYDGDPDTLRADLVALLRRTLAA